MRIDSSGNVGIGTNSPDTLLELKADTSSGGYGLYPALTIRNDNATGYGAIHFNEGSTQRARIEVGNNSGSPYLGLHTGSGTNGIRIDSSGNVGIGTTSPYGKLRLNETAGSCQFYITSSNTSDSSIIFGSQDDLATGSISYFHSDDSLRFSGYNNQEAMRIDNNKNLLVGTTALTPGNGNTDTGLLLKNDGRFFASSASNSQFNRNSDGDIVTFRQSGNLVGSIGVGASNNMYFESTASSHTGLTFPDNAIVPRKDGSNSDAGVNLGTSGVRFKDLYLSNTLYIGSGTGTTTSYISDYEDDLYIYNKESAGKLFLGTNNDTKVIIDSSGKVGIGETSPRKVLHVKGNESGAQVVEIEQENAAGIAGMHFSFNDTQAAHLGMGGASYTGNTEWQDKFFIGTITDKAVVISQNDEACVIVDTNQDVIIGSGHNSATPGSGIIKAASASGFNNTGGDLRLYGGTSTGDNAGGEIEFYTGAAASSGTQANTPVERVRINDKGIKQYNRFVSGTILPTAFVGCHSWYDLSGRYSTVVTSGNDLTSCTDASGEGRATLIKNTVATGSNLNATLEQFPSGIYGFRFDRSSYITGTSHTSGYTPPTGTNARTLWCIIYNFQEITSESLNHFLHYGTNTTSQAYGIAFTPTSNEFGQHTWGGNGQEVDADTDIAGGFTNNGTTPRDVYVLFSSYDGGTGETRVYRGGMEGVSAIGSISINTGSNYALHVGSRINSDNGDENCDTVMGEFGAFSRRLTTKEMDLMASSLLLRWS